MSSATPVTLGWMSDWMSGNRKDQGRRGVHPCAVALWLLAGVAVSACNGSASESAGANGTAGGRGAGGGAPACTLVEEGFGPQGTTDVRAEEVVSGLVVPWGLAFLPGGGLLVTERPGRLRLVEKGQLQPSPVATVATARTSEGGLLGLALHPDFASNRLFYLYYTTEKEDGAVNRVERWRLADDRRSASRDTMIVDDIPAATFHNGGRLRFGPDGLLYIGTGDARSPNNAQDRSSLAGKLLRLTPEGQVPEDNPFPDNPAFLTGVRNTQGFDWTRSSTLWLTDHGPSGELGRTGHDEVNVARAGDNLGWPAIYGCQSQSGMVTPALTWDSAVPPGGAAIYTGDAIPEWQGDLIIGTLGSRHLHRVAFADDGALQHHSVYLQGGPPEGLGRIRTVKMSPDGALYVMTSNCDGRGTCPPGQDRIFRIMHGQP